MHMASLTTAAATTCADDIDATSCRDGCCDGSPDRRRSSWTDRGPPQEGLTGFCWHLDFFASGGVLRVIGRCVEGVLGAVVIGPAGGCPEVHVDLLEAFHPLCLGLGGVGASIARGEDDVVGERGEQ